MSKKRRAGVVVFPKPPKPAKYSAGPGEVSIADSGARYPRRVKTSLGNCARCAAPPRQLARLRVTIMDEVEHVDACAECAYEILLGGVLLGSMTSATSKTGETVELVLSETEKTRVRGQASVQFVLVGPRGGAGT